MYIFIFILVLSIVYIKSFEDDFQKELLDKATPFVALLVILTVLFLLLSAL